MTSFEEQLDRAYKKKVLDRLDKTVRAVALVVDRALVEATPVDTGRARANWQASLNNPLTAQIAIQDVSKKDSGFVPARQNDALKAISAYKLADTILISNNLPYIRKLNEGSSQQAPAGFVDAALLKGKKAVKR